MMSNELNCNNEDVKKDNVAVVKDTVDVWLLGQRIALKSEGSPELVNEVLDLVSLKIKEVEQRTKIVVPHHVALLALLDLAEEYIQSKHKAAEYIKNLDMKTGELFNLIESEINENPDKNI